MHVLAIGAHHDDVELGCGGALLAWRAGGASITVFTASTSGYRDAQGREVRPDAEARAEGHRAAALLGATLLTADFPTFGLQPTEPLRQALLGALEQARPDVVLTHWTGDVHQDHRAVAQATLHVARHVPRLLAYRSNWYNGDRPFDARHFVDITAHLEGKVRLVETFASENARTQGRWVAWTRQLAAVTGLTVGVDAAEGFEVVRWLEP